MSREFFNGIQLQNGRFLFSIEATCVTFPSSDQTEIDNRNGKHCTILCSTSRFVDQPPKRSQPSQLKTGWGVVDLFAAALEGVACGPCCIHVTAHIWYVCYGGPARFNADLHVVTCVVTWTTRNAKPWIKSEVSTWLSCDKRATWRGLYLRHVFWNRSQSCRLRLFCIMPAWIKFEFWSYCKYDYKTKKSNKKNQFLKSFQTRQDKNYSRSWKSPLIQIDPNNCSTKKNSGRS